MKAEETTLFYICLHNPKCFNIIAIDYQWVCPNYTKLNHSKGMEDIICEIKLSDGEIYSGVEMTS